MLMLSVGAPPDLIVRSQRASIDEVRHAEKCFGLASRYRAHPASRKRCRESADCGTAPWMHGFLNHGFRSTVAAATLTLIACGPAEQNSPPRTSSTITRQPEKPSEPQLDLATRNKNAYHAATAAADAGDFKKGISLLEALVPEAKEHTDDDMEFWIHNELTWLHWADGDLKGALTEVDAAKGALDRSAIDEPSKKKLKLHELWDRAYVDLEISIAAPPENRSTLYSKADDARNEYQELALAENDHDGMAVLEAFFAVRKNDGNHAKIAAKRVDIENDADLQDLYVLALALDLGGDLAAAQNARARICSGHEYLMKPLIVHQLARDGHACAP